jgi:subtilisin family serine protease
MQLFECFCSNILLISLVISVVVINGLIPLSKQQFITNNNDSVITSNEIVIELKDNITLNNILSNEYLNFKQILFDNFYIFELKMTLNNHSLIKRSTQSHNLNLNEKIKKQIPILNDKDQVKWFQIQRQLIRSNRFSYYENEDEKIFNLKTPFGKYSRDRYKPQNLIFDNTNSGMDISMFYCNDGITSQNKTNLFNDEEWPYQWYLNDACAQGYRMNVTGAWNMGYTGRNVVVSIIDDGVERNHLDLIKNYEPLASIDLNGQDNDPMPRYETSNENKHGTRCAGEVAGEANNNFCGAGVAFNSRIGGIRLLDGKITDRLEAQALNFNTNIIDIFSASWGPLDNGQTLDGPGFLSQRAFIKSIIQLNIKTVFNLVLFFQFLRY